MLSDYSPSLAGGSGAVGATGMRLAPGPSPRAHAPNELQPGPGLLGFGRCGGRGGSSTSTLEHVAASPCRIATRSSNASCPRNFYDDPCDCSDALLAIAFGLLSGLSGRIGGQSHPDALARLLT